jgi:hypothetical protein
MVDAAVAERARQGGRGANDLTTTRDACIVRVRNETGSDLSRFNVVGLDEPIFLPDDSEDAFLREVAFRGVTPATADHRGKFAILLEPAPVDRVVRAYLAGVCPVQVDVVAEGDTRADVDDGSTGVLTTAGGGSAQILWAEGGTGVQWAVVRFGGGGSGRVWRIEYPADGIEPGASAECHFYDASHSLSSGTITVWNRGPVNIGEAGAYEDNRMGFAAFIEDEGEIQAIQAFCPAAS